MTTSSPLYIYLQRPDNGEWVTVGRYVLESDKQVGTYRYSPRYAEAGLSWTIDPVNLPFSPVLEWEARRYRGLHDVLRDACPDSWGRMLLQKEHNLPHDVHDSRYLALSSNADRWGALAIGTSRKPSVAVLASPKLPQLEILAQELLAIFERRPPVDAKLRRRLVSTPSMGGARPKATVYDGGRFWLVKPFVPTDVVDIPLLEHFTQRLGREAGLNFAQTEHHKLTDGLSVVRVLRFDRHKERRSMTLSGASMLQTEYPGAGPGQASRWSYPRLAEELKRIGAPREDCIELFARMVFNAVVGNNDDHPRNHAALYRFEERRWRLAPAFDVVPDPDETPRSLALQLSTGRHDISREAILADAIRFGFNSVDDAGVFLDRLLERVRHAFAVVRNILDPELQEWMSRRMHENLATISQGRVFRTP